MPWIPRLEKGQEVSEPVVRDSLGEALEEYAPTTPEEEVLFKDGDPEADVPPPPKRVKNPSLSSLRNRYECSRYSTYQRLC